MELKEKQIKILEVAVELFKEKGYMGSSVRDLATRLNIKAASLYAHIRSKEEILEWICFGVAHDFFKELQEVKNIKLSVVDNDHSSYSERLINKVIASGYFILEDVSASNNEAMKSIESGSADIILDIRPEFEKDLINSPVSPR